MASSQIHQRVMAPGCNNLLQQQLPSGAGAGATALQPRWKQAGHTASVLDSNACFKQVKEYDHQGVHAEPTSVLDLQTSPGRSCSSLSSSQQSSLCSSDDSSFPLRTPPGQHISTVVQEARCKDESSGNSRAAALVEESRSDDHKPRAGAAQQQQLQPQNHDMETSEFSSWMDCMDDAAAHADMPANDMDFDANVPDDGMTFEYGTLSCCSFEMSSEENSCFPIFAVSEQDICMFSEPPPALNCCYPLDHELKFFNNPAASLMNICRSSTVTTTSSGPPPPHDDQAVLYSNDVGPGNESLVLIADRHAQQQLVSSSTLINSTTAEGASSLCGGGGPASLIPLQEQPAVLQPPPEFMRLLGSQLNDNLSNPRFSQTAYAGGLFEGGAYETVTHCSEEISAHAAPTRSSSICLAGQEEASIRSAACCWTAAAATRDDHQPAGQKEVQVVLVPQQLQELAPPPAHDTSGAAAAGLQLVHLLLACAEAIHSSHFELARATLRHLRAISSPYGDPMQRIAFHFAEALTDRLNNNSRIISSSSCTAAATADDAEDHDMKGPPRPGRCATTTAAVASAGGAAGSCCSSSSWSPSVLESEMAYQAFYQVLPFEKFAHFTGNQAIMEAVASSARIHVLDLDVGQGLQWPAFLQSLVLRPGGPPAHLRMTAVGSDSDSLQQTGRRLKEFARTLQLQQDHQEYHHHRISLSFEYNPVVVEKIQDCFHEGLIQLNSDETLVVNCSQVLHRLLVDHGTTSSQKKNLKHDHEYSAAASSSSSAAAEALDNILLMIRNMNPKLVTLLEVEADYYHHNNSSNNFLARFVEALHYYCALFDTLEATLPRESSQRTEIENTVFASQIKQIVSVEEETVEEEDEAEAEAEDETVVAAAAAAAAPSSTTSSSCCCRGHEPQARPQPRRHMRSKNWQTHFQKAGFTVVAPSSYAIEQAHQLLDLYMKQLQQQQQWLHTSCNNYVSMPYKLAQDSAVQQVLTLGWHETPIIAISSWTVA
ncbi:hypothetical protein BDL97_04G083600 [Sphagnum fallax]|nr:hypothetical protein BDL97_04G083600 [Sphagnum fallax]